jgi:hypothetical protein
MVTFRNNNNNNRRNSLEEMTEASNRMVTDQNLDQIFLTMKILKEKFLEETIIMHQN